MECSSGGPIEALRWKDPGAPVADLSTVLSMSIQVLSD